MKINELTVEKVKLYARIDYDDDDVLIESFIPAAIEYILSQTGLSFEKACQKDDLAIAALVICCEMYENRNLETISSRKSNANKLVENILAQYCVTLL